MTNRIKMAKFRLGKKSERVILDEKGYEVAVFSKGMEELAQNVVSFLNEDRWFSTEDNQFPEIGERIITSDGKIGYFNGNYKFINEIDGDISVDEIIWTRLPTKNK